MGNLACCRTKADVRDDKSLVYLMHYKTVQSSDVEELEPCPICFDGYEAGDVICRPVRCNHYYHKFCALQAVERRSDCPMCRTVLDKVHPEFGNIPGGITPHTLAADVPEWAQEIAEHQGMTVSVEGVDVRFYRNMIELDHPPSGHKRIVGVKRLYSTGGGAKPGGVVQLYIFIHMQPETTASYDSSSLDGDNGDLSEKSFNSDDHGSCNSLSSLAIDDTVVRDVGGRTSMTLNTSVGL